MADYVPPGVVEKRVRYFDGQFLQDQDFIDEQNYQRDREHRHIRLLHGPGIADGLTVTSTAANAVTVSPGTAIDPDGNQLALAQATDVPLPAADFNDKQGITLYISYLATPEDLQTTTGISDNTRWLERPLLTALPPGQSYPGTATPVPLATLALDNSGRVSIDAAVRSYSGLLLPGAGADPVALNATGAGPARLTGSLTVDGRVGIGTPSPANDLEIGNYQAQDRFLALKVDGGNAHISGVKMWTWQENYGYSLMFDERNTTGNGLHIKAHNIDPDGVTKLFVGWSGNIGINTTIPEASLHLNVPSQPTPINALEIDVQSFVTQTNLAGSYFIKCRDVGANSTLFSILGDGSTQIAASNVPGLKLVVGGKTWIQDVLWVSGRLIFAGPGGGWWGVENPQTTVGSTLWMTAGGAPPAPSDARLKTGLRPIGGALDLVRKLRGVRFQWGEAGLAHFTRDLETSVFAGPDATDEENQRFRDAERHKAFDALAGDRMGLIAQDVEQVAPELVSTGEGGYKHVSYQHLTALLTEAIKEQDAAIQALSAQVADLRTNQSGDTTGA